MAPLKPNFTSADRVWFFVGNPGAGKSTLANAVAQEPLFKSGLSFGGGLTNGLDVQWMGNTVLVDTPGLDDPELRQQACEAITTALRAGGQFKVIFVCLNDNARVRTSDIATMQAVLDACGEIKAGEFGILINQCIPLVLKGLQVKANRDKFEFTLLNQLSRKTNFFHFLPTQPELEGEENKVVPLESLPGLREFLDKLPLVSITPGKAKEVQKDAFEALSKKIQAKDDEIKELLKKVDQKDRAAEKRFEALHREHQEELKKIQKNQEKKGSSWDGWKQLAEVVATVAGGVAVPVVTGLLSRRMA